MTKCKECQSISLYITHGMIIDLCDLSIDKPTQVNNTLKARKGIFFLLVSKFIGQGLNY